MDKRQEIDRLIRIAHDRMWHGDEQAAEAAYKQIEELKNEKV